MLIVDNSSPTKNHFLNDVLMGLSAEPKRLNCKYFYDKRGSKLFEEITLLPEYYLTRTELFLLQKYGESIAHELGSNITLIEYGCGSSDKLGILLKSCEAISSLIAVDISKVELDKATQLAKSFNPNMPIVNILADFTKKLDIKNFIKKQSIPVIYFPASTIGNFPPSIAISILKNMGSTIGRSGKLLIGVDTKKNVPLIEAAYNDKNGITSSFNKNILRRINLELSGNFNLDTFEHLAFYNKKKGRIEMHLKSIRAHQIIIDKKTISFEKGETIHTENSYKYSLDEFKKIAEKGGFKQLRCWTDIDKLFSLHLLLNLKG